MHLRSAWSDDTRALSPASKGVEAAVIHHTVGAWTGGDKAAWLRGLEHSVTNHVAPGNSQALVALDYNMLIFPDGDVWEGRGFSHEDAATYHYNGQSVSWALIGNYDTTPVPDVVVHALAESIKDAIRQGWLREHPSILGHRDVGTFATACPGRFTEARLPEVRALVASASVPTTPTEGFLMALTDDQQALLAVQVAHIFNVLTAGKQDVNVVSDIHNWSKAVYDRTTPKK